MRVQTGELSIQEFLQVSLKYLSQPPTDTLTTMSQVTELDVESYINNQQSAVPSSQRVVTPEGEFPMYVKQGSTKIIEGVSDKGNKWRRYTAVAVIDDPNVREATNLETPTARIGFFLDIDENGDLLMGVNRNTTLGKLLKVTGNDKQGWSYGSIEGVSFKGRVKHSVDREDAEKKYADVVAFSRA